MYEQKHNDHEELKMKYTQLAKTKDKTLQEKSNQQKQEIDKLRRDIKSLADEKDERISELTSQVEKLQTELTKARNSNAIGVQRRQSVQQ